MPLCTFLVLLWPPTPFMLDVGLHVGGQLISPIMQSASSQLTEHENINRLVIKFAIVLPKLHETFLDSTSIFNELMGLELVLPS